MGAKAPQYPPEGLGPPANPPPLPPKLSDSYGGVTPTSGPARKCHPYDRQKDGSAAGWIILCPGCGYGHLFHASRWAFDGNLEEPTFSPSMLVNGDPAYHNPAAPRCHSYVRNGKIEFLADCTHDLAGQTVELERW
jgi:hypothetical protein